MSRATEGRISALAHLALAAIKKGNEVADLREDRLVLIEIKAALNDFFSVDDALAWIGRIKPARAILTNLHSDLDYDDLRSKLPPHVEPAFDGLTIELPVVERS